MKTLIAILVVVVLAVIGYYIYGFYAGNNNNVDNGENQNTEQTNDNSNQNLLPSYFEERVKTLGVEDVGQPVEGFDAELLMNAYPGLENRDFVGVAANNGHYQVENEEVVLMSDGKSPVSSADNVVTDEGYGTLLANLSERLSIPASSEEAIDRIIEAINTGEGITTKIDQGASAMGVKVIPKEVLEDSRCPSDVTCIQAGTVRLTASVETASSTQDYEFTISESLNVEDKEITLVRVEPSRISNQEIDDNDYTFYFEVTDAQ